MKEDNYIYKRVLKKGLKWSSLKYKNKCKIVHFDQILLKKNFLDLI
jgi:hypothetical protein